MLSNPLLEFSLSSHWKFSIRVALGHIDMYKRNIQQGLAIMCRVQLLWVTVYSETPQSIFYDVIKVTRCNYSIFIKTPEMWTPDYR